MTWLERLFDWWRDRPHRHPPRPPKPPPPAPDPGPFVAQLLSAHNAYRASLGVKPLALSPFLLNCAASQAVWMGEHGLLTHDQPDSMINRIRATGYDPSYAGENIAMGYATVGEVLNGWRNSNLHWKNIVDPNYASVGFGSYRDARGEYWWCADFGAPSATGEMLLSWHVSHSGALYKDDKGISILERRS